MSILYQAKTSQPLDQDPETKPDPTPLFHIPLISSFLFLFIFPFLRYWSYFLCSGFVVL